MSSCFHIAIDGPVSAGKGTISRLVAEELGFLYVDTGAMYRVAALVAKKAGIDLDDEKSVVEKLKKTKIEMSNPTSDQMDGRLTTVLMDGQDVSWAIRTEEMSLGSSQVAKHPKVRSILVKKQQEIAENQNVIMEGRDITYRVLPQAQLKIFLMAGDVVRAKRRHLQYQTKGINISFEEVYQKLLERDAQDTSRSADPLQIVPDAWVIDSSDLSIQQVVDLIVAKVKVMMN